jgi:hypothetical protein
VGHCVPLPACQTNMIGTVMKTVAV